MYISNLNPRAYIFLVGLDILQPQYKMLFLYPCFKCVTAAYVYLCDTHIHTVCEVAREILE